MAKSGDVLEIAALGMRVVWRRTADETGGEVLEADVIGRPRGFITQEHVHRSQLERLTVVSGAMRLEVAGREHVLRAGESMEVPAGTPHRQRAEGSEPGHVRIEVRPGLSTQAFLERLAQYSADGRFNRFGYPKPVAGAELIRDFGAEGHGTMPPLPVQRALSTAVLAISRWWAGRGSRGYEFVDEWDVPAPIDAVFAALADARTYPEWWRPVYIDVAADGPPVVGRQSRQHFKGRLPYHLHTRSTIARLEPPRMIEGEVEGDLSGRGIWTLTPAHDATHVRFDWTVNADRPLLRTLTPVLRPLFRWNHNWAIARAKEGLAPYAQLHARAATAASEPVRAHEQSPATAD